jgi:hypothetical protein
MIGGGGAGRGYLELTGYGEPLKLGSDMTFDRGRFALATAVIENHV